MKENTLRIIAQVLSIILGLFFVLSGIGKVLDVAAFARTIAQYGTPILSRLSVPGDIALSLYGTMAIVIPPLEVILGLGLLAGYQSRRLSAAALAVLVFFTAAFGLLYFGRGVENCGCFGAITVLDAGPVFSLIRNSVLLIIAAVLALGLVQRPGLQYRFGYGILLVIIAATMFAVAGRTSVKPISLSQGKSWAGHAVGDTPLAPFVQTSPDSTYLFFVYSPGCRSCWDAAENVKAYERTGVVDQVIGIARAEWEAIDHFKSEVGADFRTVQVPTDVIAELLTGYPLAMYVESDTVRYARQGGVVSPYSLRRGLPLLMQRDAQQGPVRPDVDAASRDE